MLLFPTIVPSNWFRTQKGHMPYPLPLIEHKTIEEYIYKIHAPATNTGYNRSSKPPMTTKFIFVYKKEGECLYMHIDYYTVFGKCLMYKVLTDMLEPFVIAYIDISICSLSVFECVSHVRAM